MIRYFCLILLTTITTMADSKSNSDFNNFCNNGTPTIKENYGYGFEEAHSIEGNEQLKCKKIDMSKYKGFSCQITENTFGAKASSYLLEKNNHRVFIFRTISECRDSLDTMNANAP